ALKHNGLSLTVKAVNYMELGENRGGTVEVNRAVDRLSPCNRPFTEFTVYNDGSVLPCCQFFPDLDEHKQFAAGKVEPGRSIFPLFASGLMASFRRDLFAHGEKSGPAMCAAKV